MPHTTRLPGAIRIFGLPASPATRRTCAFVAMTLTLSAGVMTSGCAYHQSSSPQNATGYQWRSLYPQDVHTVAVPIFTNRSYTRGVEMQLTKAVVNQIEATTPYKVVSRDRADTILEGEIVSVQASPVSEDLRTTLPQEQLVNLRTNFVWKDLRSGRILVQRNGFEQATTYYPTLGENQFVANQQAVERLAAAMVEELQSPW